MVAPVAGALGEGVRAAEVVGDPGKWRRCVCDHRPSPAAPPSLWLRLQVLFKTVRHLPKDQQPKPVMVRREGVKRGLIRARHRLLSLRLGWLDVLRDDVLCWCFIGVWPLAVACRAD